MLALLATTMIAVCVRAQLAAQFAVQQQMPMADVAPLTNGSRLIDGLQHDVTIEGSKIGGDLTIIDGSNIRIVGSSIEGSVTLQNGCKVQGDEVQECDGSRRPMKRAEKAKMRKRVAQIKRNQRRMAATKGGSGAAGRKAGAASKTRAGRRAATSAAAKAKATGSGGKKSRSKAKARAAIRRMNAGYTPCNSCPTDGGDGGEGGGDGEIVDEGGDEE